MHGLMPMIHAIFHHVIVASDEWPHVYGKPTDCYCEPEVTDLGGGHRVVSHQDMTGRVPVKEIRYG